MSNQKIKVLCFTNEEEDYLADSILLGLLQHPGLEVWQYPVKKILYKNYKGSVPIRGKGFTLYHILEDLSPRWGNPQEELKSKDTYDLIIFSSIQRQFDLFQQYFTYLRNKKVWIFDGEDTPAIYPYHGYYWRRPALWFLPRAHTRFLYFKREWTPETLHYLMYKLIPRSLSRHIPPPKNLKKISFSIPESKICHTLFGKTKLFPLHIVDEEVAVHVVGSSTGYAFDSEQDYYADLRQSMYGITTKRSGWDCLRHYEIAANGAVICFRDLDKKPETCAPHDLIDGVNCISYSSYKELIQRIDNTDNKKYFELQQEGYRWIKQYTCEACATELISKYL